MQVSVYILPELYYLYYQTTIIDWERCDEGCEPQVQYYKIVLAYGIGMYMYINIFCFIVLFLNSSLYYNILDM